MNKPVAPWEGTRGLHKEEIAKKHSKEDLAAAHKHMKIHGK